METVVSVASVSFNAKLVEGYGRSEQAWIKLTVVCMCVRVCVSVSDGV